MGKNIVKVACFVALIALIMPFLSSAKTEQKLDRTPLEAKEVKIHKKEKLPVTEKGKPVKPPVVNPNDFAAVGVTGEIVTGKRYAILVGICDYPDNSLDICVSDGDAWRMEQSVKKYGFTDSNTILLRDGAATYNAIVDAIERVKALEVAGDEVVFFFSGHGTTGVAKDGDQEKQDEGIVAHNGATAQVIWDGQLRSWFDGFDTSRIIFVFDSCRAGGMDDVKKDGRIVVMSSAEKENSFVYSQVAYGEGLFSHYFNEAILSNAGDGFNLLGAKDQKVAVEEAAVYTREKVDWYVNYYGLYHLQTVNVWDSFENDLIL